MTALARATVLDLRTIAPYRRQVLLTPLLIMAMLYSKPEAVVPALVLLSASSTAGYPFMLSDRSDLDTLYAVLPITRRSLLLGRYMWALATFVITAGVGTAVSVVLAKEDNVSYDGRAIVGLLVLSWAVFALNISIQFPLFVRFGYTYAGMLGTTLPIALVAVIVAHTHLNLKPNAGWLILLVAAGVAVLGASIATAMALDPRRDRRAPAPAPAA